MDKESEHKRVTMEDIAREAGVSTATVSMALRGLGRVGTETRLRITKIAQRLNYPFERIAPKTETRNLGFVAHERPLALSEEFWVNMLSGAQKEALRHGYHVIYEPLSDEQIADRQLPAFLSANKVDGVVAAGWFDIDYLQAFMDRMTPTVLLHTNLVDPPLNAVVCDNFHAAETAANYLLAQGHRKIGLLGGSWKKPGMEARFDGFRWAMCKAGIDLDEDLTVLDIEQNDAIHGYQAAQALHERAGERMTAVLCLARNLAVGVLRFFRHRDIAVPKRMSVLGFDDLLVGRETEPPLTTVHIQKHMMGRYAVSRLIELLNATEEVVPVIVTLPCQFCERQSTGPAPAQLPGAVPSAKTQSVEAIDIVPAGHVPD